MNVYSIGIEVEEGKVKEILDRLTDAQNEIYNCYSELEALGVLKIKKAGYNEEPTKNTTPES